MCGKCLSVSRQDAMAPDQNAAKEAAPPRVRRSGLTCCRGRLPCRDGPGPIYCPTARQLTPVSAVPRTPRIGGFKDRIDAPSEVNGVPRLNQLIRENGPQGAGVFTPVDAQAGVAQPQDFHRPVQIGFSCQAAVPRRHLKESAGMADVLTVCHDVTSRANAVSARQVMDGQGFGPGGGDGE